MYMNNLKQREKVSNESLRQLETKFNLQDSKIIMVEAENKQLKD
jgi:hypothetical protein